MVTRADAPLQVEGAEHFVERNYRESGAYQWVRETLINSIEADTTRIEFGTEWQGVELAGIYRRTIMDNGRGMTPDELVGFFKTYGGSGKPIGGLHENFGIGAKSSLFPWNRKGVVIVSWHEDYADPSMIWVRRNPETGEYGLRTWDTPDGGENVIVAGEDEDLGIDWSLVKPEWVEDHGTAIILLGDDLDQDTVLGDSSKGEGGVPGLGIVNYLNRRMWDLGDIDVTVDEYRGDAKDTWPRSASTTVRGELQRGTRRVYGARWYIHYPPAQRDKRGEVADQGTLSLSDGTEIDWYLWDGDGRDGIRNAAQNGYLCAKYEATDRTPELFDVVDHPARFRAFGISETDVRKRLWLVARPPLAGSASVGVYMSSDRSRLLIKGGAHAGDPLPWDEWAVEFADNLPKPIIDAISRARAGRSETDLDASWRERLAERFGRRWRQIRLFVDLDGEKTTEPTEPGQGVRAGIHRRPRRKGEGDDGGSTPGGRTGKAIEGRSPGEKRAKEKGTDVGLPEAVWESDEELFDAGMFAVWNPPSQANPTGLIQLNVDHPVLHEEIRYWAPQYPTHLEEEVVKIIKDTYAQMAVALVAHSESLRPLLERREEVDTKLRTPEALTAGLLGLVGASAIIGPTLGGALGRRRNEARAKTARSEA